MKKLPAGPALLALLSLAACGQGPSAPTQETALVGKFGSVGVVRNRIRSLGVETEGVSAFGLFGAFAQPQPIPSGGTATLGTCTVLRSAPAPITGPVSPPTGLTSLDAGDALTLSTASGPYARLGKTSAGGFTVYSSLLGGGSSPAAGPVPAGLTLQIPGASGGFPAFPDVALPDAPALDLGTPDLNRPVAADASFTWTAAPAAAGTTTLVTLQLLQAGANGAVGAQCLAPDTGSFRLPQGTRDELARLGFSAATSVNVSRTRSRQVRQGDAAVIVSVTEALTALPSGTGATGVSLPAGTP